MVAECFQQDVLERTGVDRLGEGDAGVVGGFVAAVVDPLAVLPVARVVPVGLAVAEGRVAAVADHVRVVVLVVVLLVLVVVVVSVGGLSLDVLDGPEPRLPARLTPQPTTP